MQTYLEITRPIAITDAVLFESNIPETDHPEWLSGSTYGLGARVIVRSARTIYESVQAGNTGRNPATERTWWLEVGSMNRWRAFDAKLGVPVASVIVGLEGVVRYTLRPTTRITALALINVAGANTAIVEIRDAGGVLLMRREYSMRPVMQASSWWHWFFGQRRPVTQVFENDLPLMPSGSTVMVELRGTTALTVGEIVIGQSLRYGFGAEHGASIGIRDFSRKESNAFGDVQVVRRAFAKTARISMLMTDAEVDSMQTHLAAIRATPCLWRAAGAGEALQLYGFYKNFEITFSYPGYAMCELEIEGLT